MVAVALERVGALGPWVALRAGRWHRPVLVASPEVEVPPASGCGGSAIVTGGLGALGMATARWLARTQGIAHLALVGRTAPSPAAREALAQLAGEGVEVSVHALDVGDAAAVKQLVDGLPPERPLRWVVHAAGVLDDGVVSRLDAARVARVFRPKVHGAWNLHEATRGLPVERFVLFASAAGLLGNPGQATYAAANAYLDGLAALRRSQGLPALSVDWGPWRDGMAAALPPEARERIARLGIGALSADEALALLAQAVHADDGQTLCVALEARARLGPLEPPPRPPVRPGPMARPGGSPGTGERRARGGGAPAPPRRGREIPGDRPLQELGFDSLMALELRATLMSRLDRPLPPTLAFDHPTVQALAQHLAGPAAEETAAPPPPGPAAADEPIAIVGMGCRFPGGANDPRERSGSCCATGTDAHPRGARRPLGRRRLLRPRPGRAGQDVHALGRLPRPTSTGFDAAFFGISPREAAAHGPAAAPAARGRLGGARARRPSRPSALAGSRDRRLRRRRPRTDYARLASAAALERRSTRYFGTGNALEHRRRAALVHARPAAGRASRSTPPARRRWSRSTWPARACARASATLALAGGVNLMLVARSSTIDALASRACWRRTAAARPSTPAPTATSAARAAAWSCSSGSSDALARRRPDPGRDPRHGRQPGRPQQRPHRARTAARRRR